MPRGEEGECNGDSSHCLLAATVRVVVFLKDIFNANNCHVIDDVRQGSVNWALSRLSSQVRSSTPRARGDFSASL